MSFRHDKKRGNHPITPRKGIKESDLSIFGKEFNDTIAVKPARLTTKSSTEEVGKLGVLPEYRHLIKKNYPEMTEKIDDKFWLGTSKSLGREGKYKDEDYWLLTTQRVNKLSPQGIMGFNEEHMTKADPELYKAYLYLKQKGASATEQQKDEFLKKYADYQARQDNARFKEYGMKETAFVRKVGDKYELIHAIAPEQLFLDDVEKGKFKDKNGLKLSFNQVQGKSPNSGGLNSVNMYLVPSEGGYTKKQIMNKKLGNYVGEVVSIDDLDKSMPYKAAVVITKIIDDYHYQVGDRNGHQFVIRDTDIREAIGDIENDFRGLGKQRHAEEVVPIIRKSMNLMS